MKASVSHAFRIMSSSDKYLSPSLPSAPSSAFEGTLVFIILWKCSHPLQVSLCGHFKCIYLLFKCIHYVLITQGNILSPFSNKKNVFDSGVFNLLFFLSVIVYKLLKFNFFPRKAKLTKKWFICFYIGIVIR